MDHSRHRVRALFCTCARGPAAPHKASGFLTAEEYEALFATGKRRSYCAGEMIFSKGDPGLSLVLIEKGRAEISIISSSGRKSVLAHMGQGEILVEIAALDGGRRTATAVASSAMTVQILSRKHLLTLITKRPNDARAIIEELCRKFRNPTETYCVQATNEGVQRLARALLRLFDKWSIDDAGAVRLEEKFSQGNIGEFGELARENVNRYIKGWTDEGILRIDGRQLVLLDWDALDQIADH